MNRKALFLFAIVLLVCFSACNRYQGGRQVDSPDDFEIRIIGDDEGIRITNYIGIKEVVRIPSQIQQLPVVEIGDRAFFGKGISSVTIPSSVTTIGVDVFSGNQLTSVVIPNSVKEIGAGAFSGHDLAYITIPNSVNTIGIRAFSGTLLASITIGPNVEIEIPNRDDLSLVLGRYDTFVSSYYDNGRRAGTYNYYGSNWSMR